MIRSAQTLYVVTAVAFVSLLMLGVFLLGRTGLPSADVVAQVKMDHPLIQVSDYAPGDAKMVKLAERLVIVWRRDEADKALAASQNDPALWLVEYARVLGEPSPVFADDTNLVLEGEWFFALAELPIAYSYLFFPSGDFDGFFATKYAQHYDLSGRVRKGWPKENLTVIRGEFSADRQSIQLDLSGRP
jgi:hypothetical protein